MINLAPYPFIRFFIPLALGILLFNYDINHILIYGIPIASIILYVFIKNQKNPITQFKYSFLFNFALFGILTFTGWLCSNFHNPHTLPNEILNKEIVFSLQVEDIKQNNTTTDIIGNTTLANRKHKILTTIKGNKYDIEIGDIFHFKSTIEPIRNVSVPDAFDYSKYMKHQGILYKCYIDSKANYHISSHKNTLRFYANDIKNKLIKQIRKLELNETTTSFIITLFTGDKKFIEDDTREVFSSAGVAHLLAISGLHISLLALILGLILRPFVWLNHRNIYFIFSITIIWAFTYMTGFSSSAIRASIMTSLLFSAIMIHRKYSIINALFISATTILIFNPSALFDIGFQLSYSAVLGIICFAKLFTFGSKDSILRKASNVLAVTISAQIGTFLLILYYFNSFSISFFISNLVIIPILPFFILMTLIALIFSSLGVLILPITNSIDLLYSLFDNIAVFSSTIPYTQFTELYLNGISTFIFFVGVISLGIWLRKRNIYFLRATTSLLAIGCVYIIINITTIPRHGFFLASDYDSTNIVYYENKNAYIFNADNNPKEAEAFVKKYPKFMIKHGIKNASIIDKEYKNGPVYYHYPILYINGIKIAFAKGNINKTFPKDLQIKTDYLIVSKAFYNDTKTLLKHFVPQEIVLPLNVFEQKKNELIQDFNKSNLLCTDLGKGNIISKEFN